MPLHLQHNLLVSAQDPLSDNRILQGTTVTVFEACSQQLEISDKSSVKKGGILVLPTYCSLSLAERCHLRVFFF